MDTRTPVCVVQSENVHRMTSSAEVKIVLCMRINNMAAFIIISIKLRDAVQNEYSYLGTRIKLPWKKKVEGVAESRGSFRNYKL
jgi:hypothetical protein